MDRIKNLTADTLQTLASSVSGTHSFPFEERPENMQKKLYRYISHKDRKLQVNVNR